MVLVARGSVLCARRLQQLLNVFFKLGFIDDAGVGDLVMAVKSYAYEGKGQKQTRDVNASVHATLVILAHKFREKEIALEKEFGADLPLLATECSGLNQVWTNLLDNAIDAVGVKGRIEIKTWAEVGANGTSGSICVSVVDMGRGLRRSARSRSSIRSLRRSRPGWERGGDWGSCTGLWSSLGAGFCSVRSRGGRSFW